MRLKALVLTVLISGASLLAQETPVSLDSCRAMALHNNKSLQMSRQRIRTAEYARKEAFSAYLPALDLSAAYMYNQHKMSVYGSDQFLPIKNFDPKTGSYQYSLVTNPETGIPVKGPDGQYIPEQVAFLPKDAMTFDIHNVFFGALTLTQPLYMGGKIVALNRLAEQAHSLTQTMYDADVQNVVYAVDAAYWQVVSLKAKHALATSYVNLLRHLSENVTRMVEAGVATRSDQLSVEVKLNSAQVDLVKVENGLALSRMALAQVCGLPVTETFPLADENTDTTMPENNPDLPLIDMQQVYERRPDIRALGIGVEMAEQQTRIARASMLPNLVLVGAYSVTNPNMNNGFEKRFGGNFSVGAMLTVPLWHWGGNLAKYKGARSAKVLTELQLEDARELVELQVNQAELRTREAYKTYSMTCTNLEKADANLRTATLGYEEGVATADNVMEAQTAWLKAHSEQIDAMIDVRLCNTYLSKALGTLIP